MKSEIYVIMLLNFIRRCFSQNFEQDHLNKYSLAGELNWGKRNWEHYLEFEPRSLRQCVEECYVRKRCKTFSYSQYLNLCELSFLELEVETTRTETLLPDDYFSTSSITTWPKFLFGNCIDHNCTENERCAKNGKCEISDCGAAPSELEVCGAELLVYGNHEINNGVIYRCADGLTMILEGNVITENQYIVKCDQRGKWKKMSFSCEFKRSTNKSVHKNCLSNSALGTTCIPLFVSAPTYSYYCEGNWTIIQRRVDGSVDFFRNWEDYKQGFGSVTGEYWIGNSILHKLTSKDRNELRIELEDFDGAKRFASYASFSVGDETSKYRLSVSGYSGDAGDSFSYHNGMSFTTKDRDNDIHSKYNCAVHYRGAWWYKRCHYSNLNGLYLKGQHSSFANGINWRAWRGHHYSLKSCRMMIRQY